MSWSTSDSDNPKPAFGGKAVRIRPYYTTSFLNDAGRRRFNSRRYLERAREVLDRMTLSLDVERDGHYFLDFNERVTASSGNPQFRVIRDLIDRGIPAVPGKSAGIYPPSENRLIVVFATLSTGGGYTVIEGSWLPWVLVDCEYASFVDILIHEIGHACRLAHFESTFMEEGGGGGDQEGNFVNYQANEIYRSYWCTGSRPVEWWDRSLRRKDTPFMWPPFGPTP